MDPPRPAREQYGPIDVLSDTQGVDFGPYLKDHVMADVRRNWYALIPASAQLKKGKLAIEFAVRKDGNIAGMKLVASSGDRELDRAAWGGITASNPFPSLPGEFKGQYLTLRFRFYYNPDAADLKDANSSPLAPVIVRAAPMTHTSDSNPPKYPKKARKSKVEGTVQLEVVVGTDGKIKDLRVLEGDPTLADASVQAIRKWRFYPAREDGRPIEDRARIRVDFRLDPEQVKAQVVSYSDSSSNPAPYLRIYPHARTIKAFLGLKPMQAFPPFSISSMSMMLQKLFLVVYNLII